MHANSGTETLNVATIPQLRQRTRQSSVVSPFRPLSHSEARNSILPPRANMSPSQHFIGLTFAPDWAILPVPQQ